MASEMQFPELAAILRRRKGLIIAITLVGTVLTAAGALLLPPRYTAKAQLIYEPQYIGRAGEPPPAVNPAEEDSVIPTQVAILLSHDQMSRLRDSLAKDPDFLAAIKAQTANKAGTDSTWRDAADAAWRDAADAAWQRVEQWMPGSGPRSGQANGTAPPQLPQESPAEPTSVEPRVPSYDDLDRRLNAMQQAGSHVIAVTYTAASPEMAAAVANRAVALYVESQNEQKQVATNRELAWLGERIPAIKAEVDRAEAKIQGYETAHGYAEVTPGVANDQQIADLTRQLATAEADLAARQGRLDYVRGVRPGGNGTGALFENLNSPTLMDLRHQELALQQSQTEAAVSLGGLHPKVQDIRGRLQEVRQSIAQEANRAVRNLEDEARIASTQVNELRRRLATLEQAGTDMHLRDLKYETSVKQQLYSNLVQRQEEVSGERNVLRSNVRLLSRASPPNRPSSPSAILFVFPGMIAFLIGGSLLAVFTDRLDSRLRSQRDVDEALGIPCLALVPKLRRIGRTRPHQSLLAKPLSAYTEAIRSVVASLQLAGPDRAPKVVLVSSSVPGEGKTTLAVSLASYVASLGRRVLLVDLDFRHSSIQRELGGKAEAGVLDLLLHERSRAEVIQHLPDLRLDYLPVSRRPADPFALFASNQMRQLLGELRGDYDLVIIDGPPLLVITEARLLASMVDKVLFVVKWGSTRRDMVQNALALLRDASESDTGRTALTTLLRHPALYSETGRNALSTLLRHPGFLEKGRTKIAGVVLAQVDLKKHARSRYGDVAESFTVYRKSYIESEAWPVKTLSRSD